MSYQQRDSPLEMAQQAVEFPMSQTIEYQRSLAQVVLNGLTMADWLQSRGVKMTRQSFDNYLQMLDATDQQFSQASAPSMQTARSLGRMNQPTAIQQQQPHPTQQTSMGQQPQQQVGGGPQQYPPQQAPQQPPQQPAQQAPQQPPQQAPQQTAQQAPPQELQADSGQQPTTQRQGQLSDEERQQQEQRSEPQ